MTRMVFTGSKSCWFSFKVTAISALEIKLSFYSICSMMELTGNFKKLSGQSFEVLVNILSLTSSFKRIRNMAKILKYS